MSAKPTPGMGKINEDVVFWAVVCVLCLGLAIVFHSVGSRSLVGMVVGWLLIGGGLGISLLGVYWNLSARRANLTKEGGCQ